MVEETKFPNIGKYAVDEDWKMNFNGAANRNGNGIEVPLISPDQTYSPLSYRLDFHAPTIWLSTKLVSSG